MKLRHAARQLVEVLKAYYLKRCTPFMANWIILSRCNCRCPFCELGDKSKQRPDQELSTKRCLELADELAEIGIRVATLSGGEPFLHKDLFLILERLKKHDIDTGIVTNGFSLRRLNDEEIQSMKNNLNSLVISLDSSLAEEHDQLRGFAGLFNRIIEGVRNLQGRGFSRIAFETIIMGPNYKRIPEIVRLAKDLDIQKVMFRPINKIANFPQLGIAPRKDEFADLDVEDVARYVDEGVRVARRLRVDTDLSFNRKWIMAYLRKLNTDAGYFHDDVMGNYFCFIPYIYIVINFDGELLPCLLLRGDGNVTCNPLKDERGKSDHIRGRLARRDFFDACKYCFDQANNNFRFSAFCSPLRNVHSLGLLAKDMLSVYGRFHQPRNRIG